MRRMTPAPDADTRRLHALVSGRVQGVGYRWRTVEEATRLALTGWVRNLPDGRVEILAEGRQSELESLLRWARSGPPASRVDDLQFRFEAATREFTRFDARR
jgi:acylphosphatase